MEAGIYNERLSSAKTGALFIALTIIFLLLSVWRWIDVGMNTWTIVFLCFFAFFLFYSRNYRTLKIHITPELLQLTFGIFTWTITIANISTCYTDKTSLWRIGGAGIHFTWIKRNYRAFFNFLDYPRLVITLKRKKGPVREIAFSTNHPEHILECIRQYSG